MKKVLYLTNIQVPYRVRFFNALAEHCDLTVLYERQDHQDRDRAWSESQPIRFRAKYRRDERENIKVSVTKELLSGYDAIIVGCINTPVQIFALCLLKAMGKPYLLNLDGEPFLDRSSLKTPVKRFLICGASAYLTAGEASAKTILPLAKGAPVIPYYFSSMTEPELTAVSGKEEQARSAAILVPARNLRCKGVDIALECARSLPGIPWIFVGMGEGAKAFRKGGLPANVTVIPYLQTRQLHALYSRCSMMVLPSRRECWGLVIQEAAAHGTPIVSTWGSGAAVEFLGERYPQFLAQTSRVDSLLGCIQNLLQCGERGAYSQYLQEKARHYTIERSVRQHLLALDILEEDHG